MFINYSLFHYYWKLNFSRRTYVCAVPGIFIFLFHDAYHLSTPIAWSLSRHLLHALCACLTRMVFITWNKRHNVDLYSLVLLKHGPVKHCIAFSVATTDVRNIPKFRFTKALQYWGSINSGDFGNADYLIKTLHCIRLLVRQVGDDSFCGNWIMFNNKIFFRNVS